MSTALAAVGLNVLVTVLFKQTFDISGNELDIGWIGLAQFVPAVLLFLVSGWVADRFDRRRVTALFLLGRVACAFALVVYSQIEPGTLWPLFMIAFVFGAVDAMISPARRSIAPLIADQGDFPHVVALWTATFTASAIIGPVLGGFLYSVGPSVAYALAGVLELAAIVPILMITYRREQDKLTERPTMAKALEGLHFVRKTPVVLATISLDLFAVLFGGAIALIPAVAEEQLHVGDIAYGWLRAAPGIGAAFMAVWLAVRPIRRRVGPTLLVVVAIFGLGTVVFGLTKSYAVAFVALVVISAADMISMYIRGSIVPLVTPERPARPGHRGRGRVHRRIERARRVRERRRRTGPGTAVGDRGRRLHHDRHRRSVRPGVPVAAQHRHLRRTAARRRRTGTRMIRPTP